MLKNTFHTSIAAAALMLLTCFGVAAAVPEEPDLPEVAFEFSALDALAGPVAFAPDADAAGHADAVLLAHAGQLSSRDECHNMRAVGERHWHLNDTSERGGPCIVDDGRTFYLTNHDLCAPERAALVRADEDFWTSKAVYIEIAFALKDCILGLPAPDR